jgi:D-glycero-alpha-D-manno-heptose-7-phosphate kinase
MLEVNSRAFEVEIPLRVSFVGGGTDVNPFMSQYGGTVVSATITKVIKAKLQIVDQNEITISEKKTGSFIKIPTRSDNFDLPIELVCGWISLLPKNLRQSFHLDIESAVLPGSGLGASSSVAVATCKLAKMSLGVLESNIDLAIAAYKIEREFLGIVGGCQDHYAAAIGGFNIYEFTNYDSVQWRLATTDNHFSNLFFANLTLVWTGLSRNSSHILFDQVSKSEKGLNLAALQKQKSLVPLFMKELENKSIQALATILTSSWHIKKDFAEGVSNRHLDSLFDSCLHNGALGGKLLGAGGGGYFLFLSDPNETNTFREFLVREGMSWETVTLHPGIGSI